MPALFVAVLVRVADDGARGRYGHQVCTRRRDGNIVARHGIFPVERVRISDAFFHQGSFFGFGRDDVAAGVDGWSGDAGREDVGDLGDVAVGVAVGCFLRERNGFYYTQHMGKKKQMTEILHFAQSATHVLKTV